MLRPHSKSILVCCLGVMVSCLSGALLVAFHAPLRSEVDRRWLLKEPLRGPTIYHFATADCRCSDRLLNHLIERRPKSEFHEVLVYIGPAKPVHTLLEALGYEVRFETSTEASGVQAAPWLLVRDSGGRVSYSGGYERSPYWESRILFNVEHRLRQASLGTAGCATSKSMRAENIALRLKELLP